MNRIDSRSRGVFELTRIEDDDARHKSDRFEKRLKHSSYQDNINRFSFVHYCKHVAHLNIHSMLRRLEVQKFDRLHEVLVLLEKLL